MSTCGRPVHPQASGNLLLQRPGLIKRHHLFIASQTLCAPLLLHAFAVRVADAPEHHKSYVSDYYHCTRRLPR